MYKITATGTIEMYKNKPSGTPFDHIEHLYELRVYPAELVAKILNVENDSDAVVRQQFIDQIRFIDNNAHNKLGHLLRKEVFKIVDHHLLEQLAKDAGCTISICEYKCGRIGLQNEPDTYSPGFANRLDLESYLQRSHGPCESCAMQHYPAEYLPDAYRETAAEQMIKSA